MSKTEKRTRNFVMRELENTYNIMRHTDGYFIENAKKNNEDTVEYMIEEIRKCQDILINMHLRVSPELRKQAHEMAEDYRKELARIEWEEKHNVY